MVHVLLKIIIYISLASTKLLYLLRGIDPFNTTPLRDKNSKYHFICTLFKAQFLMATMHLLVWSRFGLCAALLARRCQAQIINS